MDNLITCFLFYLLRLTNLIGIACAHEHNMYGSLNFKTYVQFTSSIDSYCYGYYYVVLYKQF